MRSYEEEMAARHNRPEKAQPKPPRVPVAAQLTEVLADLPTLISTSGQGFALLPCAGAHTSYNVTLKAPALQHSLLHRSINRGIPIPTYTQLRDTMRGLAARCYASGTSRHLTHLRTAWNPAYHTPDTDPQPAIVLSLDTRAGSHAVITRDGWSLASTKTNFLYDQVQQPLPKPEPTESTPEAALAPSRKLLRLDAPQHQTAWQTLLSWTLTALRPAWDANFHSYPILNLVGPHTSGKSVTAKILTLLLDPTGTPIHSIPSTERRLHGLAATHHILAFDDPGKINPENRVICPASPPASRHSTLTSRACWFAPSSSQPMRRRRPNTSPTASSTLPSRRSTTLSPLMKSENSSKPCAPLFLELS